MGNSDAGDLPIYYGNIMTESTCTNCDCRWMPIEGNLCECECHENDSTRELKAKALQNSVESGLQALKDRLRSWGR